MDKRFSRSSRLPVVFLFALGLLLVVPAASGHAAYPVAAPPVTAGQADLPPGASAIWWVAVQQEIRQSEYDVTWQNSTYLPDVPAAYQAPNRAHGLRIYFTPEGPVVIQRLGAKETVPWRFGLWIDAAPAGAARLAAEGNRVEYRYPELPALAVAYVNDEDGLRQEITLASALSGVPGVLDLSLPGTLAPGLVAGGEVVELAADDGTPVLRYTLVAVTDARGQPLAARLALDAGQLRVSVEGDQPAYPLTLTARLQGISEAKSGPEVLNTAALDGLSSTANWTAESNQANASFGYSVGTAGDVNGDGYSDVIVGAYYYDNGQADEGRAFVYYGSAAGLSALPAWTAESNQASAYFGRSVAGAGDINGDDYSDVIVGAAYYDNGQSNEGAAFVYHGSAAGLSSLPAWTAESNQAGAYFGVSVAGAGDVNGDGHSDVIVGADFYDNGQSDEGAAFVWLGSATGLGENGTPSNAAWMAESNQDTANFGHSVAWAGDVNGDGYSDVVVGAADYDSGQLDEGRAYVYHGSAAGLAAAAAWTAESNQGIAWFGYSVAGAGDVNGDGYSDIIVGAPLYDNGQGNEGRAYVYHGSAAGLVALAAWTAESNQAGGGLGRSVAGAGDVNGDGYGDVIVGAADYDNGQSGEGAAFAWLGSATGLGANGTPSNAAWTAESNQAGAFFGWSVAGAGDVNGDGYGDVIVGAAYYDNGQSNEGAAFVYHGSAAGLSPDATWAAEGDQVSATMGTSRGTAGDVNGDGYSDVIVGVRAYDNGQTDEGQAYVYLGSATGLGSTPAWTAEGNQIDAYFGDSVGTAGDVNGDGYSDVIVGAYGYSNGQESEGRAYVYYGNAAGLATAPAWIAEGNQVDAHLGVSVGTAGDVNGDGYGDVIVGAHGYSNGQTYEGQAYVYHGSAAGLGASPAWTAESNQASAGFGVSVGTAGDVNGDGYSDAIVGAKYYDDGQTDEGRTYVYHGGPAGLAAGPAWTAESDQASAQFGTSVATAGDVNGDGYSDVVVGADQYDNGQESEGRAYVYYGSAAGLGPSPAWTAEGGSAWAHLGFSISSAGDVNGDGYGDVAIGAPYYMNDLPEQGRVYVYHGSPAGLGTNPAWMAEGDQDGASFGGVGAAGDVNGDGYGDLLVGAWGFSGGQGGEGRVTLYYGGGDDGLHLLPRQMRTDGSAPIVSLGTSDSRTGFQLSLIGRMPLGRDDVRLQWQVAPLGMPINSTGVISGVSSWTDVLTTGVVITQNVTGLMYGTPYHWRVRLLYRPGNTLGQPAGRWLAIPWAGWNETDLRTPDGPPAAVDDAYVTDEDVPLAIAAPGILGNDSDPDGDPLAAERVAGPTHGQLLLRLDGSFVYTPTADYHGADTFVYQASDGILTDAATVAITVQPVNDPPDAQDDAYVVTRDTPLAVPAPGVLGNDSDADGDPLTAAPVSSPAHGTLSLLGNGSFTYTPATAYVGADSFTYRTCDNAAPPACDTAAVTLHVSPPWRATGPMSTARSMHTATLLNDGRVLVAGGLDGDNNTLAGAELYDPRTGTWSQTGSMGTGRYAHTATLLADGRVLVAGGNGAGVTNSVELYDPATGTWSPTGSLAGARYIHTATLLPDGRVLVVGGYYTTELQAAEIYDPATASWSPAGVTVLPRANHTATLLPDGRVLVAGGTQIDAPAEVYNPATGQWSQGGTLPARFLHTATLLPNGRVLVAGGDGGSGPLTSAGLYDPATGTWSPTGSLGIGRAFHAATLLPNGRVMVAGGMSATPLAQVELYDPQTEVWQATTSLSAARDSHTATLLPDGQVLVAGGFGSGGCLASAELYRAASPGWSSTANMAARRGAHTATLLIDGRVLVAGGRDNGSPTATAELYDATAHAWSPTVPMSIPRVFHTATLLPDGRVLVAAGQSTNYITLASAELYSPATGTWAPVGSMSVTRAMHTATLLLDGRVLVAGGLSGSTWPQLAELYDPATGTWSPTGSLIAGRYMHTATLLPDGRVLVVGGFGINWTPLDSAEIYDPATGVWSPASSPGPCFAHTATLMPDGRVLVAGGGFSFLYDPANNSWNDDRFMVYTQGLHTATLLPDGRVLAAGSNDGYGVLSPVVEIYDPAMKSWSALPPLGTPRADHTATLLPDGQVLIAGGGESGSALASAELYDPGLGFDKAWRPVLDAVTTPLPRGTSLTVTGSGFRGYQFTEASGGGTNSSATNYPLVQVRSIDNEQELWLLPDPTQPFSTTSFTSSPVTDLPLGPALVTVFVNGIPGISRMTVITSTPPLAAGDAYATDEDVPLIVAAPGVLGNDTGASGALLAAVLDGGPPAGTLDLHADGSLVYTPALNYAGTMAFTYHVWDGIFSSNVATVTIAVSVVNDRPTAAADAYATDEDVPLTVTAPGVLDNDSDVEGDPLAAALVSGPTHGQTLLGSDGSFVYTPTADYHGADSFVYQVSDGVLTDTAAVSLTIHAVNDPPALAPIGPRAVDEGTALAFTASAFDPDLPPDVLTFSLDPAPPGASIDPTTGEFNWTPDETQGPGLYTATLRVVDNGTPALSGAETFTITVAEVNQAPLLAPIPDQAVGELALLAFTVTAADADIPSNTLTFSLDAGAPFGAALNPSTGEFAWIPDEAQGPGVYTITVGVTDDGVPSLDDWATMQITVSEVNVPPIAAGDVYTGTEDTPLVIEAPGVLANDGDPDLPPNALTVSLAAGPGDGELELSADGSLVYTPKAYWNGVVTFTYSVSDGLATSNLATVLITVIPVNNAPWFTSPPVTIATEDTPYTYTVTADDVDAADILTLTAPLLPAWLVLDDHGDGTATLAGTPANEDVGDHAVVLRVQDAAGMTATQSFSITVANVNDAPVLEPIGDRIVDEETLLSFSASAMDADLDDLTFSLDAGAPPGASIDPVTGLFIWTPSEVQGPGVYSVTVRVTDDGVPPLDDYETIQIIVAEINQAPVLPGIGDQAVDEGALLSFTAMANDPDLPANTLTFSLDAGAPAGASIDSATGQFTWTPSEAQGPGLYPVTIRVTDDGTPLLDDWETLQITVYEVNLPPVAAADSYSTLEDTPLVVAAPGVLGNDDDPDLPANPLAAVLYSGPIGSLDLSLDGSFEYTPVLDYDGAITFTYRISDSLAFSDLALVTITVTPVCDYGVQSEPAAAAQSGDIGTIITYTLRVTNSGECIDILDVAVTALWPAGAPATIGPLAAGEGTDVVVTVTIPTWAEVGDQDVATFTITSQGDSGVSAASVLTTTANMPKSRVYLPLILRQVQLGAGTRREMGGAAVYPQ